MIGPFEPNDLNAVVLILGAGYLCILAFVVCPVSLNILWDWNKTGQKSDAQTQPKSDTYNFQ